MDVIAVIAGLSRCRGRQSALGVWHSLGAIMRSIVAAVAAGTVAAAVTVVLVVVLMVVIAVVVGVLVLVVVTAVLVAVMVVAVLVTVAVVAGNRHPHACGSGHQQRAVRRHWECCRRRHREAGAGVC